MKPLLCAHTSLGERHGFETSLWSVEAFMYSSNKYNTTLEYEFS